MIVAAFILGGVFGVAVGGRRVVNERTDLRLLRAREEWLKNVLEATDVGTACTNADSLNGAEVTVHSDAGEPLVIAYRESGSAATALHPVAQVRKVLADVEARKESKELRLRGGYTQIAFGCTLIAAPFFANPYLAWILGAALLALLFRLPVKAAEGPAWEIRRFNSALPGDSLIGTTYDRWRRKLSHPWRV